MSTLRRVVRTCALAAGVGLSPVSPVAIAEPAAERMTAVVGRSHGTLGLAPCDGEALPAVDRTNAGILSAILDWLLDGHDGAIHVELDAVRDEQGWRVVHLRRAGISEPGCQRDPLDYVWRAVGQEGWTLLATPRSVTISGVEGLEQRRFRFTPFASTADGSYVYATEAGGEPLEILLRPDPCLLGSGDPRAGAMSDYRATIRWRGRTLEGCARNGPVSG